MKQRQQLIRAAIIAAYLGLGVVLFVTSRGHTLLVDNRSVSNLNLRAPDMITVSVDGSKPLEFFRNDRDIFKVGGGMHEIQIEFSDGTPPFTAEFDLPLKDDQYLLSIPKLINGVEPYYEVFTTAAPQSREIEEELPAAEAEI
jgi:hypothetical protein